MPKLRRTAAAAIASLVLVAGLWLPAQGAVVVNARHVGASYRWRPATTTVMHGTQITWKAVQGSHTVQSYGGNWTYHRSLASGAMVSRAFRTRGTFKFFCQVHGYLIGATCYGMCGKIVVT